MRNPGNTWRLLGLAACTLLALAGGRARASWIDTSIQWDGKTGQSPFGDTTGPGTFAGSTYGETFLAGPKDVHLLNMSFWLKDNQKAPVTFEVQLYKWGGTQATGTPLYTSAPTTVTSQNYQQYKFTPAGKLVLTPGQQYVALITSSPFDTGSGNTASVGYIASNVYTQGSFVWLNNGTNTGQITGSPWNSVGSHGDIAFRAMFKDPGGSGGGGGTSGAPAPSGLVLGALGCCGLLTYGWRRRRQPA